MILLQFNVIDASQIKSEVSLSQCSVCSNEEKIFFVLHTLQITWKHQDSKLYSMCSDMYSCISGWKQSQVSWQQTNLSRTWKKKIKDVFLLCSCPDLVRNFSPFILFFINFLRTMHSVASLYHTGGPRSPKWKASLSPSAGFSVLINDAGLFLSFNHWGGRQEVICHYLIFGPVRHETLLIFKRRWWVFRMEAASGLLHVFETCQNRRTGWLLSLSGKICIQSF